MDPFATDGTDLFTVVPVLVGVAAVVIVVLGVVTSVRSAKRLKDAGLDPLDPKTDLAIRLAQSRMLSPEADAPAPGRTPSLTERLAELDALYRAGTISAAERDTARAKLLGTL